MKHNVFNESLRLMVPESCWDEVILAGSYILKTEEEHQNINIVDSSVFIMPTDYLEMEICDTKQIYSRLSSQRDDNLKKLHMYSQRPITELVRYVFRHFTSIRSSDVRNSNIHMSKYQMSIPPI